MAVNLDLGKIKDLYTREVFKQVVNAIAESEKRSGAVGATGPAGESFANVDGGEPDTDYGGILSLDGGGIV